MKKSIKVSIFAVIILAVIGGSIGYYLFQEPVKNFADSSADIVLPAKTLFEEFVQDQNKAIAKYVSEDKTIQIKGKILEISKNSEGIATLLIDVGNPEGDISCTLVKEESAKADKYKAGDVITIQGQCTGYQELINQEVIMIRCGIK